MITFVRLCIVLIAVIQFSDISVRSDVLTADTQRPQNLFSIASNYDELQSSDSKNELWESSIYYVDGVEHQIRWQRQGSHITVAKSCVYKGEAVVAQVTLNTSRKARSLQKSKVKMKSQVLCEIQLAPMTAENQFLIQDSNVSISGSNEDGSFELSVFSKSENAFEARFEKISSET